MAWVAAIETVRPRSSCARRTASPHAAGDVALVGDRDGPAGEGIGVGGPGDDERDALAQGAGDARLAGGGVRLAGRPDVDRDVDAALRVERAGPRPVEPDAGSRRAGGLVVAAHDLVTGGSQLVGDGVAAAPLGV